VTRISAALAGAMRCPEPEPYVALVDTLIGARLAAPDGHVGLMEVGALIGLQIVGDLLSGGEGVGQRTALMRDRLVVARDALGDSPDDRVLGAVLSVAIASIGELLGDAKELGAALASSRAVFDAVADDGVSTGAARFAPALHLATATVEAAWHARGDDDAARDGVLAVIDANGERDVTRSLAVWGAEVYTDAVLRLIRGARQLLSAEDAALDAVAAASQPGPEERGEWRVGLEISRVLLWDVASSRPGGGGALDEADVVLRRLVTAALDEWDLRHTGWEMLELVPALHHASMRMLLEGSDADAERLADELGAVVSEGLARMSPELRDGDAAALGVLAVGRDALLTADTEGMSEIVASPEARQRWLLALAARSEAYTPELRFLTRALVGRAIAEPDLASGLAWLEHASADADDPRVSEVRYGLDLLRAAALASDPARHPDALEALDAALSVGAETAACGIVHEVEAMRPVRAWLLAQGGRHDEADAELATYLAAAAAGGPTEGVLRCEITAKQPGVSVNLTVEHGLQSIVLAHLDEGSLSIGAGHESSARPLTSTTCSSRPAPAFRHDVVLRAALLRAVLRMRADRDAGAALSDAVRLVARLRTGSEFTLPPALAAGLETSRDAAPVELLAWTSAMAFAHGHVSSAELLRGAARAWTDDPALQVASTPMELRGLGLDDRAPLVAAWLGADAEQGPDRLRQALAAGGASGRRPGGDGAAAAGAGPGGAARARIGAVGGAARGHAAARRHGAAADRPAGRRRGHRGPGTGRRVHRGRAAVDRHRGRARGRSSPARGDRGAAAGPPRRPFRGRAARVDRAPPPRGSRAAEPRVGARGRRGVPVHRRHLGGRGAALAGAQRGDGAGRDRPVRVAGHAGVAPAGDVGSGHRPLGADLGEHRVARPGGRRGHRADRRAGARASARPDRRGAPGAAGRARSGRRPDHPGGPPARTRRGGAGLPAEHCARVGRRSVVGIRGTMRGLEET
jgi:hypothetical protein